MSRQRLAVYNESGMCYKRQHYADILCQMLKEKKGSVSFNDALDTFLFTVIWRRTLC